jgi:hypothetical protein
MFVEGSEFTYKMLPMGSCHTETMRKEEQGVYLGISQIASVCCYTVSFSYMLEQLILPRFSISHVVILDE